MDLVYSESDKVFRATVRTFLQENLPPRLARLEAEHSHARRRDCREWHRTLAAHGYAAPNWPRECGGTGWTAAERLIWEVEYGRAFAPEISVIAIGLVGPVLCRFGSVEMKRRYLQPILCGDMYFCQGFSEPDAGSDLASLRTRAVRDGDDYVVSGQKIWTSHAPDADMMICLCKTDTEVRAQAGMSMLLIPMDAPGLTVRPISTIDDGQSVSEIFLDEVRVPATELLGEENHAWNYTKFLLNTERTHNAYIGVLRGYLARLHARSSGSALMVRKIGILGLDIDALEWSVLRVLAAQADENVTAAASALKLTASSLLMRAADLELEQLGGAALPSYGDERLPLPAGAPPFAPGKAGQMFYWRASTIFGGSNDIQRSIIWGSLP